MKLVRFLSLFVTLVLALAIALLYPLELISDKVFKGIVAGLIGSFVLWEALQWKEYSSGIEKLLENKLEEYHLKIRGLLDSTSTNQILRFNSSKESYEYLTTRIYKAKLKILDVTMGPSIYRELKNLPEYRQNFAKAKKELLKKNEINYKHIAIINNVSRLKRIEEELNYSKKYFVGLLNSTDDIPKISFYVIDDEEVIIGALNMYDPTKIYHDIAISNPDIVELFVRYFDLLWDKHCEIIDNDKTREDLLGQLKRKLENEYSYPPSDRGDYGQN